MILLDYRAISERTGLSVDALRQRRMRGKMPPPDVQPNVKTALWYEATIDEWLKIGEQNERPDSG